MKEGIQEMDDIKNKKGGYQLSFFENDTL